MSEVRVPLVENEPLTEGQPSVRVPLIENEPLTEGVPNVRVPLITNDPLTEGSPFVRVPLITNDPLTEGHPFVRIPLIVVESLHPIAPELPMSTTPFPGFGNSIANPAIPQGLDPFNSALPGLAFSVHKKPGFKTNIKESVSGTEVRNKMAQYPRWDFELNYEFLEDRSGAESSLKTLLGFFLEMGGSFESWLFKDPDDYLVVNGFCSETDGVTTQFPFCRTMGNFRELVGQVDEANTVTLFLTVEEASSIPVTPGPYTVTVAEAVSFIEDLGVIKDGVTVMTRVPSAPAAGQYSVAAGVYTFNSADQGDAIEITYRYEIDSADYTVTMPNQVVFDSAPPEGLLSASFQFFFACRFLEDQMDFEKFYDKLWSLQECSFKSVIQ